MKRSFIYVAISTAFVVAVIAAVSRGRQGTSTSFPQAPADPSALPVTLVHAQPFTLDVPFTHWWRSEQPQFRAGYLIVLAAPSDLLVRRQVEEPVLYVGAETAERINNGDGDGRLVALVPSAIDANGRPTLDLASAPIWFGDPALPEQVDHDEAQRQLDQFVARGGAPRSPAEVAQALARGGPLLTLGSRADLQVFAADLIELYAPSEAEVAENLRVGR